MNILFGFLLEPRNQRIYISRIDTRFAIYNNDNNITLFMPVRRSRRQR